MDRDDALRRIKACLDRAACAASGPERDIALRQARALMDRFQVDGIDALAQSLVEVQQAMSGPNPPMWEHVFISAAAEAYGCEVYLSRTQAWAGDSHAVFVGFAPWPELAAYAYVQLRDQCKRARTAYLATISKRFKKSNRSSRANAYAETWATRAVHEVLAPMRRDAGDDEAEAIARHKSGLGLSAGGEAKWERNKDKNLKAARDGYADGADAVLRAGVGVGGRRSLLTHQGDD